jgi:peptidyl-dipeptidase A
MSLSHCLLLVLLVFLAATTFATPSIAADANSRAREFIAKHEEDVRPLDIAVARTWWDANVSGKDEDYKAKEDAENRLNQRLADTKAFAELKAIREARPSDTLLARQIEVLYLQYVSRQIEPELLKQMVTVANDVSKAFAKHRPHLDGKELTENQVREVLRTSNESAKCRAVWEAGKEVGRIVEADMKRLVRLRNEAAVKLGYKDFHKMQLALGEQDQDDVLRLFDELDDLTREPFRQAKARFDAVLAAQFGIAVSDLRPWHYRDPFFQTAPEMGAAETDAIYKPIDILDLCRRYYTGIGLPVDDILARSDLYEKPGKNAHAFCTDIDRVGDVRILCNIVPGHEWLKVTLHELGHGVYSKWLPQSVPYVLRDASHPLTTEGIAMMMERLPDSPEFLAAMGVAVPDPEKFRAAAIQRRRDGLLVFSRWCQVMFRFEKTLYENPEQDLNRAWWDLVEKYQELRRPEGRNAPDYAAKIHICLTPAYYHNYLMGEMFSAQVHQAIAREALGGAEPSRAVYVGKPAVGKFLQDRVFGPAMTLPWNDLTRFATGEPLSAKAMAATLK